MLYKVVVTETLERVIYVEGDSKDEALTRVEQKYKEEIIVLDDSDFTGYLIQILE